VTSSGTIRAAPALALVGVLGDLGHDPAPILAEAGWSPKLLDDPDNIVPYAELGRLVATAAEHTGCDHIGLLLGKRAGLAALGAFGFAARNAPDVRSALLLVTQPLAHHDRCGVAALAEHGKVATLGYRILHPAVRGGELIIDGAMTIAFEMMKALCGPEWRPLETSLARRPPADARPYLAQFGEPVRFGAEESAISFSERWLGRKIPGADPELQRLLLRMIGADTPTREHDLRDDVRRLLIGMVGSGDTTRAAIARAFGMSSRTLHRRLAALGTSFRGLLDAVRCEKACGILTATDVPVAQVALMLGYSETSAFTRSFKRQLGCGPAAWRATATPARQPDGIPAPSVGPGGATA